MPTPTLDNIATALRRADAAGNTEDARKFAQAYVQLRDSQTGAIPPPPPGFVLQPHGTSTPTAGKPLKLSQVQRASQGAISGESVPPPPPGFVMDGEQPLKLSQVIQRYGASTQPAPDFGNVQGGAESSATTQPRTFAQDLGRAAIMTGRNVVQGAAAPFELLHDAVIRAPVNAISQAIGSDYRIAPAQQQLDANLNAVGIPNPQPENAIERIGSGIERAASGAGGFIGAGKALAGAAGPVVSGIGRMMAANPGTQVASAVGGATGSDIAHDAGGSPLVQAGAGLAGGLVGMAPGVASAGLRGLFRGGEAGRQRVEQSLEDFAATGTTPSVGQAAQNGRMQATESLLSRTPGAAGVMRDAAERQAGQVAEGMETIASRLSPNADPVKAGRMIERGISGAGGFMDRFKAEARDLYSKLDDVFPPNTPIFANNTEKMLARLTTPTSGTQATAGQFIDSKLSKIREALGSDLDWNAYMGRNRTIPYAGLKELRSRIGERLADIGFGIGDNSLARSDLKRLYAALSEDMKDAVQNIPEAKRALGRANAFYDAGMSRIDALSRVVDKNGGPEAVFNAATSGTREGATTLHTVMQSLKPDERKVLAASMIRRLGKATPGQQNAEGDVFSMSTFLTNWNRLSAQAKSNLFGRFGNRLASDMDKIARMAANVRSGSKVYANPAGTAAAGAQLGTVGAFTMSALTGHFKTAGIIAAGAAMANLTARLMTNPAFVRWLSHQSDIPLSALSANVANLYALGKSNGDDDLKRAAELIQQTQQ